MAQATILEQHPQGTGWQETKEVFDFQKFPNLPRNCYIFLHKDDFPPLGDKREALLHNFRVPVFVANRACTELNGYFGCRATYNAKGEVTICSTWFRCLIKMVPRVEQGSREEEPEYVKDTEKGYKWFEMGIFTLWEGGEKCKVLCVNTPSDLPGKLAAALGKRLSVLNFRDPFAMHTDLLDQIIVYYDTSVWRIRDPVRKFEEVRLHLRENAFKPMHDNSRHAIHASETLAATIETMAELQRYQTDIHETLADDLGKSYTEQAKAYTDFQIQLVKSLKLRSESNQRRLENEVNLAFNNLAQQDNTVMKSIALLTMVFLPATFISALFSTTFFTFGENGWEASNRLWIYCVITVPATVLVLIVWNIWLQYSQIRKFLRTGSWYANHP